LEEKRRGLEDCFIAKELFLWKMIGIGNKCEWKKWKEMEWNGMLSDGGPKRKHDWRKGCECPHHLFHSFDEGLQG
jgi:hypothetical protein